MWREIQDGFFTSSTWDWGGGEFFFVSLSTSIEIDWGFVTRSSESPHSRHSQLSLHVSLSSLFLSLSVFL